MILSFMNNTEKDLDIVIEPSTDEFLLLPNSTLKIYAVVKNQDDEFEYDCHSNGINIWMPRASTAKFFVDGKRVDTLYEIMDW